MLLPAPNNGLRSYVAAVARAQIEIKFLRFAEVELLSSADISVAGRPPMGTVRSRAWDSGCHCYSLPALMNTNSDGRLISRGGDKSKSMAYAERNCLTRAFMRSAGVCYGRLHEPRTLPKYRVSAFLNSSTIKS